MECNPRQVRSRVLFPAPFGPRTAHSSPRAREKVTPRRTGRSRYPATRAETSRTLIAGAIAHFGISTITATIDREKLRAGGAIRRGRRGRLPERLPRRPAVLRERPK